MASVIVSIEREAGDDVVEIIAEFDATRTYKGASAGWYCPPEASEFELGEPHISDGFTLTPAEREKLEEWAIDECYEMNRKGEFDEQ